MEKYEEYGSQWQKIAFFFDGRPGLHCRNRWRKLQRMVQVKKDKEGNVNTSFFNTMAGEQPLRFQHTNPTSLAASSSSAPASSKTIPAINNNNNTTDISTTSTTAETQPHATNHIPHPINSTDASQSFQHLTTLLRQQQQQQQLQQQQQHPTQQHHSQTGQDPSVLAQYNNNNINSSSNSNMIPNKEEYDEYGNGLKPYGCDIPGCYAVFADSSGLFYHMKNNHPNLNGVGKPFRCAMTPRGQRDMVAVFWQMMIDLIVV
ncbi:hypothetical protein G6F42_026665 [Rhizopus arrhizus]|nr:hypothetical protein G6F42_026665 [Rhizopus arrhizus]